MERMNCSGVILATAPHGTAVMTDFITSRPEFIGRSLKRSFPLPQAKIAGDMGQGRKVSRNCF